MATNVDEISIKVQESLKTTPYACISLVKLSGGTANFVYRGTLAASLEDGSKTVVIKHTEPYVAQDPSFKLTTTRCDYEQTILAAANTLRPSVYQNVTVETPHLYYFSPETNTQIYTDLPSSTELKTYVLTHSLSRAQCSRVGQGLGLWAKFFHSWAAAPEQENLRETMKGNAAMKELKYNLNYTNLVTTIDNFPGILESSREVFKEVAKDVKSSLDRGEGTLIHGDFWSGNVLLPNGPLSSPENSLKMFVIDWEMSQIGSIAFDLGQMFAELFELKHFKDIDAGVWLIESFMEGYGKLDENLAFKTAIHVGAHLIFWGSRVQGWGTREQVEAVVEIGKGYVVSGWEKNRGFFDGTPLRCLFA